MDLSDPGIAADWLGERLAGHPVPELALVLGSGWGEALEGSLEVRAHFPYADIPGFPVSTVAGHAGELQLGGLGPLSLWCLRGRFHFYEGYPMALLGFPVRVLARLGVRTLLLTNAAGGIREDLEPGSLMLIEDHLNLMGDHPLRGPNREADGPRFPDMTRAWDPLLRTRIREAAESARVPLSSGIYAAMPGPSFETPAEIRALRILGADAVGMSTVPECLVARHCGLRVAGLSCITNAAAHPGGQELTHRDVAETASRSRTRIRALLEAALPRLA